jgi:hypothetical protein
MSNTAGSYAGTWSAMIATAGSNAWTSITGAAAIIARATSANVSASTDETMASPAVVIAPVIPRADA